MRTIRIFEHISVDGVIQLPGGPGDADFPPPIERPTTCASASIVYTTYIQYWSWSV